MCRDSWICAPCAARLDRLVHARLPRRQVRDVGEVGEDILRRPAISMTTSARTARSICSRGARRPRAQPCSNASSAKTRTSASAACPRSERSRQVARTTGQFLFSLVAAADRLRGARDRRLARLLDHLARGRRAPPRRPRSLARERPAQDRRLAAQHRGGRPRGLGRARRGRRARDACRDRRRLRRRLPRRREGRLRAALRARARTRSSPAALFVADNVLSHPDRSRATRPRGRPTRRSSPSPSRSTAASS